jgi:hypothetical protein
MEKLMAKISADFSGVEKKNFNAAPAGVYNYKLKECDQHVSKEGKDSLKWIFVNDEDVEFDGVDEDGKVVKCSTKGSAFWIFTAYKGDNPWKFFEVLLALGHDEKQIKKPGFQYDTAIDIGKIARVKVKQVEYEGRMKNEAEKFYEKKEKSAAKIM